MSFSCDVNVLLYASDSSSPVHERARAFLKEASAGGDLFCLGWPTVMSYLRIATHPGIFSAPLVAIAFVPFGIVARWLILATRGRRQLAAEARAAASPPTRKSRFLAAAEWPVFLILVTAVVILGMVVGTLVGPH